MPFRAVLACFFFLACAGANAAESVVRPAPPASTTTPLNAAVNTLSPNRAPAADDWLTDFAAAQRVAATSGRRLLVFFTGSDWCAPCIQFEAEVAHAPSFLNATRSAFVLVKLDFPQNLPQPPAERARNEALGRRYGVSTYPALLVISADGAQSSRADVMGPRPGENLLPYFIRVVEKARTAKTP